MADPAPEWDELTDEDSFADTVADKFGAPTPRVRAAAAPKRGRGTVLQGQLEKFYGTLGAVIVPFDAVCGTAIVENAADMAASLDALARSNPKVKAVLEKMMSTSAWGMVIAAHAPIVMTVASHHVPVLRERMETIAATMEQAGQ